MNLLGGIIHVRRRPEWASFLLPSPKALFQNVELLHIVINGGKLPLRIITCCWWWSVYQLLLRFVDGRLRKGKSDFLDPELGLLLEKSKPVGRVGKFFTRPGSDGSSVSRPSILWVPCGSPYPSPGYGWLWLARSKGPAPRRESLVGRPRIKASSSFLFSDFPTKSSE